MSERTSFEEQLKLHGKIIYKNKGISMRPLIRQGRDVMVIERPQGRLRRYDCPLYVRADGTHVLHRVLKVRENDYVICGDNCIHREFGITDDQIIGVLTAVIRDGKRTVSVNDFGYRLYSHLWCDFFYIRVALLYVRFGLAGLYRKIFPRGKRNG